MAKSATTRSEVLEQAYGAGLTMLIFAVIGLLASVLLGRRRADNVVMPDLDPASACIDLTFEHYRLLSGSAGGVASRNIN